MVLFAESCTNANSTEKHTTAAVTVKYVCLPCGRTCDSTLYDAPGSCKSCMMELVDKATVNIRHIAPGAVCDFIVTAGRENVILLDVRTAEEFNGTAPDKFGRLAGAINIPVQQLEQRTGELKEFMNKEIMVYCSHSHRSPMAAYILMQKGFTKVTNMENGMSEWNTKVSPGKCSDSLFIKQ
jgi:rhodanese-related sulfurtransferase/DNA-directed RNA polymerase subunit RPC12/RpoP